MPSHDDFTRTLIEIYGLYEEACQNQGLVDLAKFYCAPMNCGSIILRFLRTIKTLSSYFGG